MSFPIDPESLARPEHREADLVIIRDVYVGDCYQICQNFPARFVVDIGAHIGTFARKAWDVHHPERIVCVEADRFNRARLVENMTGLPVTIVAAACTYTPRPVIWSSVFDGSPNTGGSYVAMNGEPSANGRYLAPLGVEAITLESVCGTVPYVDLLKLDCEGSELSILQHATCLGRVRRIVGEWHDRDKFKHLVHERLTPEGWRLHTLKDDPIGLFHLLNERFVEPA